MKLGICDYGIGGIGLYKAIREISSVDILYISDTGYTPYGKVPEEELRKRVSDIISYFHECGVEYIAVACNAASTVIPQQEHVTGIIEHGIRLVTRTHPHNQVGIVGGIRTIESGLYQSLLAQRGIDTIGIPAQPLSLRIEAGDVCSSELDADIATIFEPLRNVEYILLACTHYPVIADQIHAYIPKPQLLDPVLEMRDWIHDTWKLEAGDSTTQWLTTGDSEKMRYAAQAAFGIEIDDITTVQI